MFLVPDALRLGVTAGVRLRDRGLVEAGVAAAEGMAGADEELDMERDRMCKDSTDICFRMRGGPSGASGNPTPTMAIGCDECKSTENDVARSLEWVRRISASDLARPRVCSPPLTIMLEGVVGRLGPLLTGLDCDAEDP